MSNKHTANDFVPHDPVKELMKIKPHKVPFDPPGGKVDADPDGQKALEALLRRK